MPHHCSVMLLMVILLMAQFMIVVGYDCADEYDHEGLYGYGVAYGHDCACMIVAAAIALTMTGMMGVTVGRKL